MEHKYTIKEIFYSIQGEGYYSGFPVVFVRFSGCNMWNGLEKDKSKSPCYFCDTDFRGGSKMTADEIYRHCNDLWPKTKVRPRVVFTGGEPALQVNTELLERFKHWSCSIETNGSVKLNIKPNQVIWSTVSPKTYELEIENPSEIKLLFGNGIDPSVIYNKFKHCCKYFYLQPIDNVLTKEIIDYVLQNDEWSLSLQVHKIIGVD